MIVVASRQFKWPSQLEHTQMSLWMPENGFDLVWSVYGTSSAPISRKF